MLVCFHLSSCALLMLCLLLLVACVPLVECARLVERALGVRHGFNKTTPATFIKDMIKSLLLGALFGPPLIVALLAIIEWGGGHNAALLCEHIPADSKSLGTFSSIKHTSRCITCSITHSTTAEDDRISSTLCLSTLCLSTLCLSALWSFTLS